MNSKKALKLLQDEFGEETFKKILKLLGGSVVYFPENFEWNDLEQRNYNIRQDYYSGTMEVRDIAQKYDLSISRVYKIIQSKTGCE